MKYAKKEKIKDNHYKIYTKIGEGCNHCYASRL